MNGRIAKKIRKITHPQNTITKKVYRRAKKQYTKTPTPLKAQFLESLEKMLNGDLSK